MFPPEPSPMSLNLEGLMKMKEFEMQDYTPDYEIKTFILTDRSNDQKDSKDTRDMLLTTQASEFSPRQESQSQEILTPKKKPKSPRKPTVNRKKIKK